MFQPIYGRQNMPLLWSCDSLASVFYKYVAATRLRAFALEFWRKAGPRNKPRPRLTGQRAVAQPLNLPSTMTSLPFNSLEQFARTAEAVAATTKKLEKAALLGEYFAHLSDADLARAARYFAGHQFAQSDARTTNVGGSILGEALVAATNVAPESLGPRYARWGDGGDVAFEIFCEAKPNNQPS